MSMPNEEEVVHSRKHLTRIGYVASDKGDLGLRGLAELGRNAEASGFASFWIPDSHLLGKDTFVQLSVVAQATNKLRVGPLAVNPVTRHPTVIASTMAALDELSGGRSFVALAAGDSAVYGIGLEPATLNELKMAVGTVRKLTSGETASHKGKKWKLLWARRRVATYLVASGPKTLEMAGKVADGVVLAVGVEENSLRYGIDRVRRGFNLAGRKEPFEMMAWIVCSIAEDGDLARQNAKHLVASSLSFGRKLISARSEMREFKEIADRMWRTRKERRDHEKRQRYTELEVSIPDKVIDSFAIAGTPDECAKHLKRLMKTGLTEICVDTYGKGGHANQMEIFGKKILPQLE